jgi:hypothetical protein
VSRARDMANTEFENLIDKLSDEEIHGPDRVAFLDSLVELAEQEIAEIEDDLEADEIDEDDEDD